MVGFYAALFAIIGIWLVFLSVIIIDYEIRIGKLESDLWELKNDT